MTANQAVKKNLSSMQVLKTLQVLLEGNYTMAELIQKLNSNEQEPVFNNSVVSKYINTCRFCGIEIPKIHNKYYVASVPFGLDLEIKDIGLLDNLQSIVKNSFSKKQNQIFDRFFERIIKFSNKHIIRLEEKTSAYSHELFNKAIDEQRKICLMYKANETLECTPLSIVEHKGRTFFNVFYKNSEKLICEDRIAGIELTNQKFVVNTSVPQVVFVLRGSLAKRYEPRENEEVIENPDGSIRVTNTGENKEILLSRLMRYDSSCEIIKPEAYRQEMRQILISTLENYGEN